MRNMFVGNNNMRVVAGFDWRPIPGWEYLYEISNAGQIARVRQRAVSGSRLKPRYLKNYKTPNGYVYFNLKGTRLSVAGLVLMAFVRKPERFEIPHHLNGDLVDCRLENLEWRDYYACSWTEQEAYRTTLSSKT